MLLAIDPFRSGLDIICHLYRRPVPFQRPAFPSKTLHLTANLPTQPLHGLTGGERSRPPLSSFDHPRSLTRRSVSVAYPFAPRHDSITLAAVVLAREGAKRGPFLAAAPCPQRREEGGGVAIDEIDDGTGDEGSSGWVRVSVSARRLESKERGKTTS